MNLFINTLASARARNFTSRDPLQAQRAILRYLLSQGTRTRFGKDHAFAEFATLPFEKAYAEYQKNVPIRTYCEFWDIYFSKYFCDKGGVKSLNLENVTWPGKIPLFCETSGTTAPTKYIPFSKEMFAANKRAAFDLTSCYLARNGSSRLLAGKLLYMAGNTELSNLGSGVLSGDMSAITLNKRPFYLKPFIAPSPEISALPWEEKLEVYGAASARRGKHPRHFRCTALDPASFKTLPRNWREISPGTVAQPGINHPRRHQHETLPEGV